MDEEQAHIPQSTEEKSANQTWYTPLTKSTSLSKYFAMAVFIVLPFIGFWLGVRYQTGIVVSNDIVRTSASTRSLMSVKSSVEPRSSTTQQTDTLPVTRSSSTSTIPLPPDPGEAGKATLAGIDSDNDGVRDDVQRWIALTYPNSAKTRAALTQGTINVQQALLYADDKEHSIQIATDNSRYVECLTYIFPDDAPDIGAALLAETLNTDSRSRAYLAYDRQLGGQVFHGRRMDEWKTSCSFDVDSLEN
jgi:hypothetical protein